MSRPEIVYGIHSVSALLKSQPHRLLAVHVLSDRRDAKLQKLLDGLQKQNIRIIRATRANLDQLADGNHQGIVAECKPGEEYDEGFLDTLIERHGKRTFLLILDSVTDPHNLGACIRTAEAAGVQAVIVPRDHSCGMNSTVSKVAAGAAEMVPLVVVTNLARTIRALQEQGVWVVGTAGEVASPLYQIRLQTPLALVMGAEGSGLRRLTRDTCDELVSIPMLGETSSLNVSVATGVCLFEILRQNSTAP
jgi:23S rRNA (guanosine2251-2'-O)-methyltransferase